MQKETPYQIYDGKLGVKIKFLISDIDRRHPNSLCLLKYNTLYVRLKNKNNCWSELRRASYGCDALILFSSLDRATKDTITMAFGKPDEEIKKSFFAEQYIADQEAFNFFMKYRYGDNNSKRLDLKYVQLYTANASVMNTVILVKQNRKAYLKSKNVTSVDIWQSLSNDVNCFHEVEHNLPSQKDALRFKVNKYIKNGYTSVISGKHQTKNAIKRTSKLDKLIISLYCLPNKPYIEDTHQMYVDFINGKIEVANIETGELFNAKDFYKNGSPVEISLGTVWNIINAPQNALIIKKKRNGAYDFNHKNRPHVNRTAPNYSMSRISLDDRDIMHTKLMDGSKVMAYYAFDDLSTAMIGIAHSKSKNHELYLDCIKNMLQFTSSKGLGMPLELEVEQHLVSDFKEGLMKAGNLFPFVRWCNATNSQEKYAENLIRNKKYGVEKRNNQNVGRHYSRLDSNRTTLQKIFDEKNDTYKEAKATYEQIVTNELQEQLDYNNELHPNQKLFPGKTRMDVFLENINPNLPKFDKSYLAKYIGHHAETSIRRSQYVTVQYQKFQLESPAVLQLLAPNNYNVDAYYMHDHLGKINEVFIYQKERFICKCEPVPTFNRANAEWTDADKLGYQSATKYISEFDSMVKNSSSNMLEKITIIKTNTEYLEDLVPEIVEQNKNKEYELELAEVQSQRNRAINDL